MLKNIIGTTFSRLITAFISFAVVIINANILGSEGVGTISLIVLGISVILLGSNFVTGGAIIYLVPRMPAYRLIVPAYLWSFLIIILFYGVLKIIPLVPEEYEVHVLILALLQSLQTVHKNILLGKEKIRRFNMLILIQSVTMVLVLGTGFFLFGTKKVITYVYALYAGYVLSYLFSLGFSMGHLHPASLQLPQTFKKIFRYGFYVQMANIFQLFNYRISYYLIEYFAGREALGIFSVGVQLSEGIWIFGRSSATVHYSNVANITDKKKIKQLTFSLVKLTCLITLAALIIAICIPEFLYLSVFGEEFSGIKSIIILLSPGILLLAGNMVLTSYFSGRGHHQINTLNSIIGFVITLGLGLLLIPAFGATGAAITASITYGMMFAFLFYRTRKDTGASMADLKISTKDLRKGMKLIRGYFSK